MKALDESRQFESGLIGALSIEQIPGVDAHVSLPRERHRGGVFWFADVVRQTYVAGFLDNPLTVAVKTAKNHIGGTWRRFEHPAVRAILNAHVSGVIFEDTDLTDLPPWTRAKTISLP